MIGREASRAGRLHLVRPRDLAIANTRYFVCLTAPSVSSSFLPQVLRSLALSNNSLGNKAAEAFGELLPGNRTLTHLDLSWNMIKVRSRSVGPAAAEVASLSLRTAVSTPPSPPPR